MKKEEQKRLRIAIESALESLEIELKALELQLKPIAPDCSLGDLLRAEMMHDQEVLNATYIEAKKRYNGLKYAQRDLDNENYGVCIDCDDAIAFERLLLIPESRYCIRCAKENDL